MLHTHSDQTTILFKNIFTQDCYEKNCLLTKLFLENRFLFELCKFLFNKNIIDTFEI